MSKRIQSLVKDIDLTKSYSVEEAVALVKKTSNVKFDAGVELHARLGIDPKKGEQQVRGTIILPHGTGKTSKVAVFAEGAAADEAKQAGADVIGGQEMIEKIKQTSKIDFDIAVAAPDMMKHLAVIAKVLGPRGLMPSPKSETVTTNIKNAVEQLKKGKVAFKNDNTGNVHVLAGRVSFSEEQLVENITALIEAIKKAKPASSKGTYLKNISLTSSMGPGFKISI